MVHSSKNLNRNGGKSYVKLRVRNGQGDFNKAMDQVSDFPVPIGMSLTNLPGGEQFNWESFDSDIPTGDGKITNLFYSVLIFPMFA